MDRDAQRGILAGRAATRRPLTYLPVDEPRIPIDRHALIVFPATFNTIGKLAHGIADTYAHSVLCETLGLGLPFVVVPMASDGLRAHPAWTENVGRLMAAGAVFVDPGTADPVSAFDEVALVTVVSGLV